MRIAVGADEVTPVAGDVVEALREAGHELELFGPIAGDEREWVEASSAVARRVAEGGAERGVVMCWTGTGASIAANKVPGVRAALCTDAPTARMAREYNRANVLALSMRLTSPPVAREIVTAFLEEPDGTGDFNDRNLSRLSALEADGTAVPDLDWPPPTPDRAELYWEDLVPGLRFTSPSVVADRAALMAFARRYDPQPFHIDPAGAAATVFGGLVASGWHSTAIMMRLYVDHGPRVAGGLVGLGVEELRWGPLHPGTAVHLDAEVLGGRRSRSDPRRGLVRVRVRLVDEDGAEKVHAIPTMLVPAAGEARPGISPR